MSEAPTITVDADPADEDTRALIEGVLRFNETVAGPNDSKPLGVFARDAQGRLVGGVSGRTIYGWFMIHVVWVHEGWRHRGLGRRLMEAADDEARLRGCVGAQVDTLSFQAPGFYMRLGYELSGEVPDFIEGSSRVFLTRRYDPAGPAAS